MNKILLLVSAVSVVIGTIVLTDAQQPSPNSIIQGVKAEEDSYPLGKNIKFTYIIKNRGKQPVTYNFSSSKQFDLWVKIGDKEVYRHSRDKMYAMMLTDFTLAPGQSKTFSAVWNQKDTNGKEIGPGIYDVFAQLTTTKARPQMASGKVRIGVGKIAVVPVTIGECIKKSDELLGKQVKIEAKFRGWEPNSNDPNVKNGPPVTRSDWAICDSTGCMYVTGKIGLDPEKSKGMSVIVTGKVKKTKSGQVYLVAESIVIKK